MKGDIGFALALIGVAGLAEGQLIAIVLIGIGALLMKEGHEKVNKHSANDSNILDRLYFLR